VLALPGFKERYVINMYQVPREKKNTQSSADASAEKERIMPDLSTVNPNKKRKLEPELSSHRLQEAIVWSEILGAPVSKRRKRRYHGD
jgi:hypothetical protein